MRTILLLIFLAGCGFSQVMSGVLTAGGDAPPVAAAPADSPGAGTYLSTQSVTLSTLTSGAAICYTIDGSAPGAATHGTCDSSPTTTYVGAISVAATTTIRAIATKAGLANSLELASLYTISALALVNHGLIQNVSSASLSLDCGPAAAFDGAHTYNLTDRASAGGVGYRSIQGGNTGHTPPDALWWEVVDAGAANFYYPSVTYASGTAPAMADGQGHTYTGLTPAVSASGPASTKSFWVGNVSGANTTFTASTAADMTLTVACYSGVSASPSVTQGTPVTSSPGDVASPTITTSAPSIVIASFAGNYASLSGAGWALLDRHDTTGGVAYGGGIVHRIQGAAGAEAPGISVSFTDSPATIVGIH